MKTVITIIWVEFDEGYYSDNQISISLIITLISQMLNFKVLKLTMDVMFFSLIINVISQMEMAVWWSSCLFVNMQLLPTS